MGYYLGRQNEAITDATCPQRITVNVTVKKEQTLCFRSVDSNPKNDVDEVISKMVTTATKILNEIQHFPILYTYITLYTNSNPRNVNTCVNI